MTIKDIARESGYSLGTVSRVLNEHPDVSAAARERVLQVVAQHNFVPNSNAKHLKQQLNSGVAILVKGMRNMLFTGLLELLQQGLRRQGCRSFVAYMDEDANEVEQAVQLCRERKPLGILFLGGNHNYFRQAFGRVSVPCVLVTGNASELGFENLSSVSTDDTLAARTVIERLLAAGHRNIGLLGADPAISEPGAARLAGCRAAFAAAGLPFNEKKQFQMSRFSLEAGYLGMQQLLKKQPGLTAVFAFGDVTALGALRALHDAGLTVPGDISLVGFDGIDQARYSIPRLATVRQNQEEIAQRSVEILMDQIANKQTARYETVAFACMEGESVRSVAR